MSFQDIREKANRVRGIPLEAVLLLVGATRDRHDAAKWHTARGILSVTGAKFMNWSRSTGGGGAIDLAIHLGDMDFKAAVEWLALHFPTFDSTGEPQCSHGSPGLVLPPRDPRRLSQVRQYLVRERSLPSSLLEPLIESGSLYADRRANAVFLLLGKEERPVGAEIRGTTRLPWRAMARGSRKDLGYFSTLTPDSDALVLCESAIDALSCSALDPRRLSISTAGARPNPNWLQSLISTGARTYCGFDADPTGDEMAGAMISLYPSVARLRPALKDWNDVLRRRR